MKTSPNGLNLIRRNEGCELTAYLDRIADPPRWSIGYGDTQNVHEGLTITQEEADARLLQRLAREFEPAVDRICVGTSTTQSQYDAMVSLSYNIGIGAFGRSSVARLHKVGNIKAAASAFSLWNKAGGKVIPALTRRRSEEAALYLSQAPVIPASPSPPIDRDLLADITRAIQRIVGVTPDGHLGQITFSAVQAAQRKPT